MTGTEIYILTERKKKLLKLIAKEFSLPKAKRGDVADLHNRLSRIKDWLKEPLTKTQNELKPFAENGMFGLISAKVVFIGIPEFNDKISNTSFSTPTGKIKL